jgi:serine/threonine protein kinase
MIETVPSGTLLQKRYRVERVLGSGGFGHVYLAVDTTSNLQCAVKEYLVTGSTGQEQLRHEATVLSQLHHPNLPAFQDAFIERGRYYIVLSYIDGNDLTDLIRAVRQQNEMIPILQILNWLLAICDAVTFLHNQQPPVIHRDIKPDNIRITPNGTAVLVDLGNAKAAADGARTLMFIRHQGTPGYAPPEQYPGGAGTDARSDVYALGATLFFALTTHEPPTVQVRNQSEQQRLPTLLSLQDYLLNNPPEERPGAPADRQFRLGVSKPSKPAPRHSRHVAQLGAIPQRLLIQLNNIVQKSMALKPRDRYQLVADFVKDLRQVVTALSTSPTPPAQPKRPIDPHSTQPDLTDLYDALQEAKEKKNQAARDSSPSPQPVPPPDTANTTCPRCGNSLVPKAAFCPRCGTDLGKQANPPSPRSHQQARTRNAKFHDISLEKTHISSSNEPKEAIAIYDTARAVNTPPTSSAYHPAPSQQSQLQQPGSAQSNVVQSQTPPIVPYNIGSGEKNHASQRMQQPKQKPSSASSLSKYRLFILGGILLVVVAVIILILIMNHLA